MQKTTQIVLTKLSVKTGEDHHAIKRHTSNILLIDSPSDKVEFCSINMALSTKGFFRGC